MRPGKRIERVDIVETVEAAPGDPERFLSLHRLKLINKYTDGTHSPPYTYDVVLRDALDVVIIALTAAVEGRQSVCLRTCLRQPLLMREQLRLPQPDDEALLTLLELPAGLIEKGDRGQDGIFRRAEIEALEETGYRVAHHLFEQMGSSPFISPGAIPERAFYVRAQIRDTSCRISPTGDGTPTEAGGEIVWIPVDDALKMCEQGRIVDMKTELGLRRLAS